MVMHKEYDDKGRLIKEYYYINGEMFILTEFKYNDIKLKKSIFSLIKRLIYGKDYNQI